MKTGYIIGGVVAVAAIAFGVYMIDVDVSGDVELPNVEVSGGELPEAEVNVGDIDVGTKEVTVTVPTIDATPAQDGDDVADDS